MSGASWASIAEECGYSSPSNACRAVGRFGAGLPDIDVDAMRRTAVERGEQLWAQAWQDVVEDKPGCITAAVRVLGRQASLLGLDQPSEIIVHTPTHAELERWVTGVLSQQAAATPIEADVIGEPIELGPVGPGELAAAE